MRGKQLSSLVLLSVEHVRRMTFCDQNSRDWLATGDSEVFWDVSSSKLEGRSGRERKRDDEVDERASSSCGVS